MRQVGDDQELGPQSLAQVVVIVGQLLLVSPQLTTLGLQRLGGIDLAVATELAHLLGDLVHPGSKAVTLTGDVAEPAVERCSAFDGLECTRVVTTAERRADGIEIGADETNVDHVPRLPVTLGWTVAESRQSTCGGTVLANSRSTSSVVRTLPTAYSAFSSAVRL